MKKIVLKLDITDVKEKQKAMKIVSSLSGIDSMGIDMKEKKMTVIGSVDPVSVVMKLRKFWHTDVVTIGPAKEEKKEEPKKEEAKKEEAKEEAKKEEAKEEKKEEKKEEGKKENTKEEAKKEEAKKEDAKKEEAKKEPQQQMAAEPVNPYKIYYYPPTNYYPNTAYNPYNTTHYYYAPSAQENPNSCNIS